MLRQQCGEHNAAFTMERRTSGQVSCFVMAAEGRNCKHFMKHQACQDYLDRVWTHTLFEGTPSCKPIVPRGATTLVNYITNSPWQQSPSMLLVLLQVFSAESSRVTFVSEHFSRICMAFATILPYLKLLRLLSIHCYFGPTLQMIRKIVSLSDDTVSRLCTSSLASQWVVNPLLPGDGQWDGQCNIRTFNANSNPLSTLITPLSTNGSSESSLIRNPEGRVGTAGKSLLPEFGGNQACIIIFEKEMEGVRGEVLVPKGACTQIQFPWLHTGPVSDPINCDNAWLEATVIHFKIKYSFPSTEELEQVSFPDYAPLGWRPNNLLIPSWQTTVNEASTILEPSLHSQHLDPVSDLTNCDSTWLEATATHFRINYKSSSIEDLEQEAEQRGQGRIIFYQCEVATKAIHKE
ncbi:hypothetical protein Aperf_G00000093306 [Anoplocephala perfoliata]